MAAIRVLVVADGNRFNFGPRDTVNEGTFSVQTFTDSLRSSASPTFSVDTAHRRGSGNVGAAPHDPRLTQGLTLPGDFNFTTVNLAVYDVIWLIGDEGYNGGFLVPGYTPIGADEYLAISNFMQGGGGVFAVGDHDGIGALMCGDIPRVRSMRKWFEADQPRAGFPSNWSVAGTDRADTLQAGPDGNFYFYGQSDAQPQPLTVVPLAGPTPVHPILQVVSGTLAFFPDHMHEGDTVELPPGSAFLAPGVPFTFPGAPAVEYPTLAGNQETPHAIARGHVIGDHGTYLGTAPPNPPTYPPTAPPGGKDINLLCVYDGHNVGVGRVLTDSSFHHYLDINLLGDPQTAGQGGGADTQAGLPPAMLADMQSFYVNAAAWLARVPRDCIVTTDRDTFGRDDVAAMLALAAGGPAVVQAAFTVAVDGFVGFDLGVSQATLTGTPDVAPQISFTPALVNAPPGQSRVVATGCQVDGGVLLPAPQRFTWTFALQFFDTGDFTQEVQQVVLAAQMTSLSGVTVNGEGLITLTTQPNPYEVDGPTSWLAVDLQVFNLTIGRALPSTPGIQLTAGPIDFITRLLANTGGGYNDPALPRAPNHPFDVDLVANEDSSAVELAQLVSLLPPPLPPLLVPVYNFAVARVRYRAQTTPASNVRVFFRMFQAATASTEFQPTTTYFTGAQGNKNIPLLGLVNGETVTIPFFANARVDASTTNLNDQTDPVNVGPVGESIPPDGSGREVQVYFGCWLDINQPEAVLPMNTTNPFGPFPGPSLTSIQSLIRGKHQCLVAEINLDPPEPQIVPGTSPANSDKLAQRNLNIVGAASPHRIPLTFDLKPTAVDLPTGVAPDELVLDWSELPVGSHASIYLPGTQADAIIAAADRLYARHGLKRLDADTVGCIARGLTYVPIPPGIGSNYAGLLTVDLPPAVRRGQRFNVIARQLTRASARRPPRPPVPAVARRHGQPAAPAARANPDLIEWRRALGAFQLSIPVTTKNASLDPETRLLSVGRWIERLIPPGNRWYAVFRRYVDLIAGRVAALGGDPSAVPPSVTGYGPPPVCPLPHPVCDRPPRCETCAASGKIAQLKFDRYGDFEGFVLDTDDGHRSFGSREADMLKLAERAWRERLLVTVHFEREVPHRAAAIALHQPPAAIGD